MGEVIYVCEGLCQGTNEQANKTEKTGTAANQLVREPCSLLLVHLMPSWTRLPLALPQPTANATSLPESTPAALMARASGTSVPATSCPGTKSSPFHAIL